MGQFEKIINFQKDFFKIEETIEPGTLLDFLDEVDKTKVIKIDHHLITPYLHSGVNFSSNNLNDYMRLSSNIPGGEPPTAVCHDIRYPSLNPTMRSGDSSSRAPEYTVLLLYTFFTAS